MTDFSGDDISSFVHGSTAEQFSLLERLVLIQSGTGNKAGVDRVGQTVRDFMKDLPLRCEVFPEKNVGDHLVFSTPAADRQGKYILIAGHMDTVFPVDTDFNWYREDDKNVYGPGVIDMKGGLVVTMFAVRALARLGLLDEIPLVLLFNSDEETGSATSANLIRQLAEHAFCAFVTECGGMDGQVVTGRKGKAGYHLDVHGRAGHAAFAGIDKASAILELCRLVPALEKLNDLERGLVLNVGKIAGGIGANTVAEHACAEIDTRFGSKDSGIALQESIEQIVASKGIAGTSVRLSLVNQRPVMEQNELNRNLYEIVKQQAVRLRIPVRQEIRQGVSDGSNIAGQGVPVVDGLGPIGEHDHSNREYMIKSSLPERCLLLACSLLAVNKHFSG